MLVLKFPFIHWSTRDLKPFNPLPVRYDDCLVDYGWWAGKAPFVSDISDLSHVVIVSVFFKLLLLLLFILSFIVVNDTREVFLFSSWNRKTVTNNSLTHRNRTFATAKKRDYIHLIVRICNVVVGDSVHFCVITRETGFSLYYITKYP